LSTDPANTVIGLVRTPEPVKSRLVADKISTVHLLHADMVDHVSLKDAAEQVGRITNGSLDYLIVNGAYSDPEQSRLLPTEFVGREDDLRKDMIASLEVNVIGVIYSINAFLPLVRKSAIKKVVAITSGLSDTESAPRSGIANFLTYSSMKAALNMVIARYSVELKEEGIILLGLCPGVVQTSQKPRMYFTNHPNLQAGKVLTNQTATAEDIASFQRFLKAVQRTKPEWKGPMQPAESVPLQKKVLEKVTIDESGSFLSHLGNKVWV
jgi:NAD(P)-dependent dehydrogenase (short-subunit alcohol dehydrogenase family)